MLNPMLVTAPEQMATFAGICYIHETAQVKRKFEAAYPRSIVVLEVVDYSAPEEAADGFGVRAEEEMRKAGTGEYREHMLCCVTVAYRVTVYPHWRVRAKHYVQKMMDSALKWAIYAAGTVVVNMRRGADETKANWRRPS